MSAETRLAFEHPEARAAATAGPGPLDRISLRDHVVDAEVGAFQQERGTTQRLRFNVVVEVRPPDGPVADDVDRVLSYDAIADAIARELAAERADLLETLAERVADRILAEPLAARAFVRVEKLDRGPGALGVEIARSRGAQGAPDAGGDGPGPRIAFLSNAAIASPRLGAVLDRLEAGPGAPILCVGLPEAGRPRAETPLAQRRVDLLAIGQNAWALAGRDARCAVVETRTELLWAARNGQVAAWAPSRLVLDARGGLPDDPVDALELAAWLAGFLRAGELVAVGAAPPEAGVPTRELALE